MLSRLAILADKRRGPRRRDDVLKRNAYIQELDGRGLTSLAIAVTLGAETDPSRVNWGEMEPSTILQDLLITQDKGHT
jgi:hypothetical protein